VLSDIPIIFNFFGHCNTYLFASLAIYRGYSHSFEDILKRVNKGNQKRWIFFSLYVQTIDQHEQAVRLAAKLEKGGRRTLPPAIVRWVMGPTGLGSPAEFATALTAAVTHMQVIGDFPVSWR